MVSAGRRSENILLGQISDADIALVRPHLVRVSLDKGQYLSNAGRPIEHHYFLACGMASIVSDRHDQVKIEVAAIGREGVTGIAAFMQAGSAPHDTIMHIGQGYAERIDARIMRNLMEKSTSLRDLMMKYVQTILIQMSSNVIANVADRLDVRLGRWLLMWHDRVDGDEILLTHELMALMIGAPRSAVTSTLHDLEGQHFIRTQRGSLMIADRSGLEEMVGPSYGTPEEEYRRLIAPFGKRHSPLWKPSNEPDAAHA